jgi:hypothetical protein
MSGRCAPWWRISSTFWRRRKRRFIALLCAAILLRELLEAGVDAKPSFLGGLERAGTVIRTLMN